MAAKKPAAKTGTKPATKSRAKQPPKAERPTPAAEQATQAAEQPDQAAEQTTPAAEQTTQAAEQPDQADSQPQPWKVGRLLCVSRNLMKGDDVRAVQLALIAAGYPCGASGANGVYGRETAQAVRRFQAFNRLIVDGKAGKYTVKALGGEWNV